MSAHAAHCEYVDTRIAAAVRECVGVLPDLADMIISYVTKRDREIKDIMTCAVSTCPSHLLVPWGAQIAGLCKIIIYAGDVPAYSVAEQAGMRREELSYLMENNTTRPQYLAIMHGVFTQLLHGGNNDWLYTAYPHVHEICKAATTGQGFAEPPQIARYRVPYNMHRLWQPA